MMGLLQLCQTAGPAHVMDLLDWLVPPAALDDARLRTRHRGIAKALLTISLVVSIMLLAVAFVRGGMSVAFILFFLACIVTPLIGAVLIRLTGNIGLGLVVANVGGLAIVTAWAFMSGGILSVALPAYLANIALLSTFGNVGLLIGFGVALGAALVLLYLATITGWLPASIFLAGETPGLMLTAMLGSLAIVVLAGYFLARDRALVKVRLREARHAAEQSSRAKAVFLRSMSQEFRAPLGAILGEATNLQVRLPADAAEQQSLQGIVTAGNYLGDLLNQLLEVSRAEADETLLRIEPVPVSQIVAPCLAIVGPEAVRREVVVEDICGELAERKVWADRVLVRQVVLNLLTNAVKFNRPQGRVSVSCKPGSAGFLRIVVTDSGPGISRDVQAELFAPFSSMGLEQGGVQGGGLGLVMSKRLIERMRGHIGVESIVGLGSSFWIDLPLAESVGP